MLPNIPNLYSLSFYILTSAIKADRMEHYLKNDNGHSRVLYRTTLYVHILFYMSKDIERQL